MGHAINYRSLHEQSSATAQPLYVENLETLQNKKNNTVLANKIESLLAKIKLIFNLQKKDSMYVRHIKQKLRSVGLSGLDLLKSETRCLADVLRQHELILAAVCGRVEDDSSALLVVTDQRIIYLNRIPNVTNFDETEYQGVKSVSADIGEWSATIKLDTDIGDFEIKSADVEPAHNFIYVVESQCLKA